MDLFRQQELLLLLDLSILQRPVLHPGRVWTTGAISCVPLEIDEFCK
jgi:hypothetical protein